MVRIIGNRIEMVRGDTAKITLTITDAEGNDYIPAEGDRIRFAAKRKYTDREPAIFKVVDTETMMLQLDPEDTEHLGMGPSNGKYFYDVELKQADGTVDTFIRGELFLLEEVE